MRLRAVVVFVLLRLTSAAPAQTTLDEELFQIDIGSGVLLDGWMMKPPSFDPGRKYPLLVYVYGEPAGQTVLDRWKVIACSSIERWPTPATS